MAFGERVVDWKQQAQDLIEELTVLVHDIQGQILDLGIALEDDDENLFKETLFDIEDN